MIENGRKILKICVAPYKKFLKINVYHILIRFWNIYKNIDILYFFI